jgi:tyrosyl-tRNA synthetase
MPLLRGTDGELKMSKSYDNYVGIAQPPEEQFGRTMSIPDSLLDEWTRLATDWSADRLQEALSCAASDPYSAKRALARRIVSLFHGDDAAAAAEAHFDRLFREHAAPDDVPLVHVDLTEPALRYDPHRGARLAALLVSIGLAQSNSEALRLIDQGAIAVDGLRVDDRNAAIPLDHGVVRLIRRGKRQYVRVAARTG